MPEPTRFAGTYSASVTPLTPDARGVDVDAIPPLVDWLCDRGVNGVLVLGTTGEGILLDAAERRDAATAFVTAARGRIRVIAHCGAQTTRDTTALAAQAASLGADAVAVIPPPYFALDDRALFAHLVSAASGCAPLPFFLYEFAARSGYSVPARLVAELRMRVPNLVGIKVSDSPWERFAPYLFDGLAVFVGPEALIHRGMAGGACGAVSGLAAALPELVVEAVRTRSATASDVAGEARNAVNRFPFHAALKHLLAVRGASTSEAVRGPLRQLSDEEMRDLDADIPRLLDLCASASERRRTSASPLT
jgi:dihydrodipicolinate synthase/N-acetylneuraminate lyase